MLVCCHVAATRNEPTGAEHCEDPPVRIVASLAATRETIDFFRALAVKHPRFRRDLERSLHTLELRMSLRLPTRSSLVGDLDRE